MIMKNFNPSVKAEDAKTNEQRSRYNQELMQFLLDDLDLSADEQIDVFMSHCLEKI